MSHTKANIYLLFLGVIIILFASCSAERKNIISKTYHNTTAHYNAYYYAKERINEIEAILEDNYDNDYNNILKIHPEIDSTLATTYQTQIEDCIKKASIAIQRHKNSKWVDDSYILIGLARYYGLDYVNAIKTFKYVNTESEDPDARHAALIDLMRTFTDANEFNNAVAVSDYLKKEKLNKDNAKELYINRAHYYQVNEDYDNMVQNLVKAAPLLKKKDGKGRLYFIIGQIYQMLGFDAEAFNYYKKCIASNPVYELDFYARLYMAQVTQLGKSSDVKAARKLFRKLLKDKKNKEFKDKIYYEMAEFELRRGNLPEAIDFYKNSVQASTDNQRQKGQSYHKLGIIYFDSLSQYQVAKAYYDSATTTLPKDFENYQEIKERHEVLTEFVEQINTIQLQDSLLALAELDTAALRTKIENIIAEEEAKQKELEEKQEKRARQAQFDQINNTGISDGANWYFGNPSAVALGQNEFKRIWGDRPLEDNWRRSNKENIQRFTEKSDQTAEVNNDETREDPTKETANSSTKASSMMSQIPQTEEAKAAANAKIEVAMYKLGNIYNFDLNEERNAISTFEGLLNRFPETQYEAEVIYQLYLINKNLGNTEQENYYKNQLISKYPNTTYAKLLANPNYTEESTEANEQQKKVYKTAYNAFKNNNYKEANALLNEALNKYQETIFTPRLRLLKILIIGETEDINLYQYELTEFIKKNPDSEITPYAKELLAASENFLKKQQRLLGTEYIKYFKQEHYFVLVYPSNMEQHDSFTSSIESFNTEYFAEQDLHTSNLILDENYSMVMVSGLIDKNAAETYFKTFKEKDIFSSIIQNSKLNKFVISKDNFNILYQSKDWEAYMGFFEKNYANGR